MLHPSYGDLINKVNSTVEEGEAPLIQSRYSIVIASAKRARQIIGGKNPTIQANAGKKPLSLAVEELNCGTLKLSREGEAPEVEEVIEVEAVAEDAVEETTEVVEEVAETEEFSGTHSLQDALAKMLESVGDFDASSDEEFDDDDDDYDDLKDEE